MVNFSFWQRWLLIVGILITVFGMLMTFLSGTPFFDSFNRQIDPVFWGASAIEDSAKLFQQWIYGVWGATIAGWGVCIAFIAHYPFRNKEKWTWNCLAVGMPAWFVLDTSLSIFYKVYFNVAFNLVVFLAVLLPLLFSRRYFAH